MLGTLCAGLLANLRSRLQYARAFPWSVLSALFFRLVLAVGYNMFKIHQRGVQWKQGVVVYTILQAVLLCNTTPIHCTPLPLHPPVMNTHMLEHRHSRVFSAVLHRKENICGEKDNLYGQFM